MAKSKTVYILYHKGYPIEDHYEEGFTTAYLTKTEASGARWEICGVLGLNNKDVEIVKYVRAK